MRRRLWLVCGLVLAALPLPAIAQQAAAAASTDADWRHTARQDVLGAYDSYVANHPGMHDPANRGFPDLLKRARDAGLEAAGRASSPESYAAALGAFSAIIHDGHALAIMKTPPGIPQPVEWPGFIVAWRGDKALVHRAASAALPPPGSEVLGCDGMDTREFITTRLRARPSVPARPDSGGIGVRAPSLRRRASARAVPEAAGSRFPAGSLGRSSFPGRRRRLSSIPFSARPPTASARRSACPSRGPGCS